MEKLIAYFGETGYEEYITETGLSEEIKEAKRFESIDYLHYFVSKSFGSEITSNITIKEVYC